MGKPEQHVFEVWEETRAPPHRHREYMQTPHRLSRDQTHILLQHPSTVREHCYTLCHHVRFTGNTSFKRTVALWVALHVNSLFRVQRTATNRSHLQLLGTVCRFLASKLRERASLSSVTGPELLVSSPNAEPFVNCHTS
uniref:Uncharacterized protein n=1 Tax=Scleropages formosus TaxID=113540 RepID=A0A8C9S494_SCLFO